MKRNGIFSSESFVNTVFAIICLSGIAYLSGINVAAFVFTFLFVFALMTYSLVGLYNKIRGVKSKWLPLQILFAVLFSIFLYFQYGLNSLVRAFLLSVAISLIVCVFSGMTKGKA